MRLLMITQKLDAADPILAFTLDWVRELAARVEHLDVICLEDYTQAGDLPPNASSYSLGKDRGKNRVRELLTFYQLLIRLAPTVDAYFSHMVPRYTWLAAPIAGLFQIPQYLWYTHRTNSFELRLATMLCRAVFSAVPDSFPFATEKLNAIGHGINLNLFAPDPTVLHAIPPLIVQVARLMPIKHQATLLQAAHQLKSIGLSFQLAIIGAVPPGQDQTYLDGLQQLVATLDLEADVSFTGGLTPEQVLQYLRQASIAVNLSPPGLFDKAALESMIVGVPTVVSNAAFDGLLRDHRATLRIDSPNDVTGLVTALSALLSSAMEDRRLLALDIQGRARTAHSLEGLMDRLVGLIASGTR